MSRTRINGQVADRVPATDRGLSYGDGLFETMRCHAGRFPLWARHMQRLALGCQRLRILLPDADFLAAECAAVIADLDQAVVRLAVTRGSGPRGYAVPGTVEPTVIVQAAPAPKLRRDWYHHGIRVHLCTTRLAAQPLLAGIKHLNRLEQVLARSEWQDDNLAEGLVCDADENLISATAANVFAVLEGELCTPSLQQCGVAGVARAELLARHQDVVVRPIRIEELRQAAEIFLTSSVRGIVPVTGIPAWQVDYPLGPRSVALSAEWQAAGFMPEVSP